MAGNDQAQATAVPKSNYGAEHIKHLGDIEGIRKNAGMYVGGYNIDAMHHLVNEIVDNSVDEFGQGRGSTITVTLHTDDSISIADDGAGIPVGNSDGGMPAVQLIFSKLHAGGKFDKSGAGAYHRSGGLHGVGATAVNALSEWLECTVDREGKRWRIRFERGLLSEPLNAIGDSPRTGTIVRFKPDPTLFNVSAEGDALTGPLKFNFKRLTGRMRELAFLNPGLKIILIDERDEDEEPVREEFKSDTGLVGYVQMLAGHADDSDDDDEDDDDDTGGGDDLLGIEASETAEAETKTDGKPKKKSKKKRSIETRTPIVQLTGELDDLIIDIAMQYTDADRERIESYCNNIHTVDGGKHVEGFRVGVSHTFKEKSKQLDELEATKGAGKKAAAAADDKKKKVETRPEDFRYGLTAVVAVRIASPQFQNQTKSKLVNSEVSGIVQRFVNERLAIFLEEHPEVTRRVRDIAVQAAKIRDAMKKAKEAVKKGQAFALSKLHPCRSKNPDETELYLVEGDSASGTAKAGRDANFQAILPLRGKILNVEKAKIHKMLGHREINELIRHIGTGITGDSTIEFDEKKRKYGKIIIMTDADVDGSHIRTLLLTFFFRQMKPLIQSGHIYIAQPPLYKFVTGKAKGKGKSDHITYVYSEEDRDRIYFELGQKVCKLRVRGATAPADAGAQSLKEGEYQAADGIDLKRLFDQVVNVEKHDHKFLRDHGLTVDMMIGAAWVRDAGTPEAKIEMPQYCITEKGIGRLIKDDAEREAYIAEKVKAMNFPEKPVVAPPTAEGNGGTPTATELGAQADADAAEANGKTPAEEPAIVVIDPKEAYIDALSERIKKIPRGVQDQLKTAFEKIDGYGARFGFTLDVVYAPDVQVQIAAGKPAPLAVDTGKGVMPAYSLLQALELIRQGGRKSLVEVVRFKGLGEMNADELCDTAMAPEKRKLKKVQLDDVLEAENLFSVLMGTNVRDRYNFIQKEAPRARLDV